jgi:hypothetical protein
MVLCREMSLVKRGTPSEFCETMEVKALTCKCWTCEYCAPRRRSQLRALAHRGKPNTFLTLTVNPSYGDGPDHRAQELRKALVYLRRAARKKYGYERIPFLAVFERTKRGEPHLHILLRVQWLDQKWISAIMKERMDAPIVDIRRVKGEKEAAAYVSKYVGKDPVAFKGCKRYWRSQDWDYEAAALVAAENKRRAKAGLDPMTAAERKEFLDDGVGAGWASVEIVRERFSDIVAGLGLQGWAPLGGRGLEGLRCIFVRLKGGRAPPVSWKEIYRGIAFGV